MALNYTINWSDDTLKAPFTLPTSTINVSASSLKLTGRNTINWGEPLQENILHLLENFASNGIPPAAPTVGQLWYNAATNVLSVYNTSGAWVPTGSGSGSGGTVGPTGPAGPVGTVGPTGPAGLGGGSRTNANLVVAISGTAWSDSAADAALNAAGFGAPILGDIVTEYNTAAGFSETRFWDMTAWVILTAYLNGNLLVSGTVAADRLAANSITALQIAAGTITADKIAAGALTVDDASITTLKIAGEAVTVPRYAQATTGVSFTAGVSVQALTCPALDVGAGQRVVIMISVVGVSSVYDGGDTGTFTNQPITYTVKRNGVTIDSFSTDSYTMQDIPGAGSIVYTLWAGNNYGGTVSRRTLLALGVKR